MIDDLEGMITEQLKFFYKKCNAKPERILYYRDGVSEGQFQQVGFSIRPATISAI